MKPEGDILSRRKLVINARINRTPKLVIWNLVTTTRDVNSVLILWQMHTILLQECRESAPLCIGLTWDIAQEKSIECLKLFEENLFDA